MTGYELHDAESGEELGAVIITKVAAIEIENSIEVLNEAWESFNKLEETEENPFDVDTFVVWFNENYVTQIERLYLEFIQH